MKPDNYLSKEEILKELNKKNGVRTTSITSSMKYKKNNKKYVGGKTLILVDWKIRLIKFSTLIIVLLFLGCMAFFSLKTSADNSKIFNYPLEEMSVNGFIFENSDKELITDNMLNKLNSTHTNEEMIEICRWGINEIYARHHVIFGVEECSKFYNQFDWYDGKFPLKEDNYYFFNLYEKENIRKLDNFRDKLIK